MRDLVLWAVSLIRHRTTRRVELFFSYAASIVASLLGGSRGLSVMVDSDERPRLGGRLPHGPAGFRPARGHHTHVGSHRRLSPSPDRVSMRFGVCVCVHQKTIAFNSGSQHSENTGLVRDRMSGGNAEVPSGVFLRRCRFVTALVAWEDAVLLGF